MRRRILIGGGIAAIALLIAGAFFVLNTWGEVNRVTIDRPAPGIPEAAEGSGAETDPQPGSEPEVTLPPSEDGVDIFLLVGSDSRDELENLDGFGEFAGTRADVVMVLFKPRDDALGAAILSLPRDLWVPDLCTGGMHKLNDALEGCGNDLNGATELLLTVEQLIGIGVDHFALVDLAGFQDVVDVVGGYEVCVENAVRDSKSKLSLPAGCTDASGAQTLAWLRSRSTQELTDGGWRTLPGVNDLTRNQRQREFMIDMMGRLSELRSPQDLATLAKAVAPMMTIDDELGILDAVGLAWTMRGLDSGSVEELEVTYADAVEGGAAVLVAVDEISEVVNHFLTPGEADSASAS